VDTWTDAFTLWASVEDLSSKEALRDTAFTASISTRLTLRYRSDITVGQRINDQGRILEVAAPPIDMEGRQRETILLCREISP
jgi:SPP1 family predicted phage head-tail adaptor